MRVFCNTITEKFMRAALIVFLFSFCVSISVGQTEGKNIPLPDAHLKYKPEFSGLAAYRDSLLLLLPQYNGFTFNVDTVFRLYTLPLSDIGALIRGERTVLDSFGFYTFRNLVQVQKKLEKEWDGFEAVTVVGNELYFSVETSHSNYGGYILKGHLAGHEIVLDTSYHLAMPDPHIAYCDNAGFESLTYYPAGKKLLAIYEYNAYKKRSTGYVIRPSHDGLVKSFTLPRAFFRITDIAIEKNTVYAVNYYWGGEYDCYIKGRDADVKTEVPQVKNADLKDKAYSFGRIIKMNLHAKRRGWQVVIPWIDTNRANWEGIVRFGDGFLLVSDSNQTSPLDTKLTYFTAKALLK
jgi:hypothetical protein